VVERFALGAKSSSDAVVLKNNFFSMSGAAANMRLTFCNGRPIHFVATSAMCLGI